MANPSENDFRTMPPLTGLEMVWCWLLQRCHTYGVWASALRRNHVFVRAAGMPDAITVFHFMFPRHLPGAEVVGKCGMFFEIIN
jgi:hypothetical protein